MKRLDDCGDVLTLSDLSAVLQVSARALRRLRQHGAFPIPELPQFPKRYGKAAVRAFLEQHQTRLRRVG